MTTTSAIVLLAHGSPDPRHAAGIENLTRRVAQAMPGQMVRHGYFDHHGPDLLTATENLPVGTLVEVVPLLFSTGVHLTEDVPRQVSHAKALAGRLQWRLVAPMPPTCLLPAALRHLDATAPATRGTRVVLLAAGSTRSGALAGITDLAERLQERVAGTCSEVVVANGPRDPVLMSNLPEGTFTGQLWLPVMYADGVLLDAFRRCAAEVGARVVDPLGQDPEPIADWCRQGTLE